MFTVKKSIRLLRSSVLLALFPLFMGCSKEGPLLKSSNSTTTYLSFENEEAMQSFNRQMQVGEITGHDINPRFISASQAFEDKIKVLKSIEEQGDGEAYWNFIDLHEDEIWYFDTQERMHPVYAFEGFSSIANDKGLVKVGNELLKIYKNKLYLFPLEMENKVTNIDESELGQYSDYLDADGNQSEFTLRGNCSTSYTARAFNPDITREVEFKVSLNDIRDSQRGLYRPQVLLQTVTRKRKGKLFGGYKWVNYSNVHYHQASNIETEDFNLVFNGQTIKSKVKISFSKKIVNYGNSIAKQTFEPEDAGHIVLNSYNPNLGIPDLKLVYAGGTSQGVITGNPEIWAQLWQSCN
ncbi:hypothetical protein [Membranihabitans marinus]|uniref:hypothetical protein n=1 Tax=Membranihabitans marinus TaxID=1227546 RepID=UPI001F1FD216|nr:hypothetical protein [Membranihabitans marinus]